MGEKFLGDSYQRGDNRGVAIAKAAAQEDDRFTSASLFVCVAMDTQLLQWESPMTG